MLAGEAEVERQTLRRCRERYDLLERLLSRLGEAGVAPGAMRATLDRFATTAMPYRGAEEALDEAGGADRLLASLLASAGCHSLAARISPGWPAHRRRGADPLSARWGRLHRRTARLIEGFGGTLVEQQGPQGGAGPVDPAFRRACLAVAILGRRLVGQAANGDEEQHLALRRGQTAEGLAKRHDVQALLLGRRDRGEHSRSSQLTSDFTWLRLRKLRKRLRRMVISQASRLVPSTN